MKRGSKKHNKLDAEAKAGLLFALPFIIGLVIFTVIPFVSSFIFSFTNYNMKTSPDFVGLANYKIMLANDSLFWPSLWNTIVHVLISTPLNLIFGVMLALLLNNKLKGMNVYRTIFYLPNVVSMVAMALLWLWLFQPSFGLINQLLGPIYKLLGAQPIGWLNDASTSKLAIALMGLWTCGGSMVIYLAQLQDIPRDLYEAAEIDGANGWQRMKRITIPLMTPAIFYNLIMTLISGFQVFMQSFIMTSGGPARATYYFAYYLYDKAFKDGQMGMASAMAWFLLVATLIVTMIVFVTSRRWVFYMNGEEN